LRGVLPRNILAEEPVRCGTLIIRDEPRVWVAGARDAAAAAVAKARAGMAEGSCLRRGGRVRRITVYRKIAGVPTAVPSTRDCSWFRF